MADLVFHSSPPPLHIAPRSDDVLIDVTIGSTRGIDGVSHITVTDDEIPPPTSDVVDINTVGNVWINISQIKGKWSSPGENGSTSSQPYIANRVQWSCRQFNR